MEISVALSSLSPTLVDYAETFRRRRGSYDAAMQNGNAVTEEPWEGIRRESVLARREQLLDIRKLTSDTSHVISTTYSTSSSSASDDDRLQELLLKVYIHIRIIEPYCQA